jgi:hypothetical protein
MPAAGLSACWLLRLASFDAVLPAHPSPLPLPGVPAPRPCRCCLGPLLGSASRLPPQRGTEQPERHSTARGREREHKREARLLPLIESRSAPPAIPRSHGRLTLPALLSTPLCTHAHHGARISPLSALPPQRSLAAAQPTNERTTTPPKILPPARQAGGRQTGSLLSTCAGAGTTYAPLPLLFSPAFFRPASCPAHCATPRRAAPRSSASTAHQCEIVAGQPGPPATRPAPPLSQHRPPTCAPRFSSPADLPACIAPFAAMLFPTNERTTPPPTSFPLKAIPPLGSISRSRQMFGNLFAYPFGGRGPPRPHTPAQGAGPRPRTFPSRLFPFQFSRNRTFPWHSTPLRQLLLS